MEKPDHTSLRTKTFRTITVGALIMLLLFGVTGLLANIMIGLRYYHEESRHLMDFTLSLLDMEYVEKLFQRTGEVYYSLPEEVRSDPYSAEFKEAFYPLVDDDFFAAREILVKSREMTENRNMFLMFTDPEESAIVFVVDGDEMDWAFLPGQWVQADLANISTIENSSWRLMMTYSKDYGLIGTNFRQISASDGSSLGYIVLDVDMNDFLGRVFHIVLFMTPAMVIMILLAAYMASRALDKHIITHVTSLARAAEEYTARDKVAQPDQGITYFDSLSINTGDELEELWRDMNNMETDFNDTMKRLRTVTAEQEHLEAELSIATQIQVGTLPHTFPAFPERREFDIYASMIPAKEVGGDFYDFFLLDDDHLTLLIADVSGKGISAALFMVNAKAVLRNQAMISEGDVIEIFEKVNERLVQENEAMMFVTVWLGILTISTGRLVYANGGHEYPAVYRKGGSFTLEKDVHSGPLAAGVKMKFKAGEFTLSPGDTIFEYTDGVTEANNSSEELFGTERLLQALNREPDADPRTLDENVHKAIQEFAEDTPQFDDMTMLCLKYYG